MFCWLVSQTVEHKELEEDPVEIDHAAFINHLYRHCAHRSFIIQSQLSIITQSEVISRPNQNNALTNEAEPATQRFDLKVPTEGVFPRFRSQHLNA